MKCLDMDVAQPQRHTIYPQNQGLDSQEYYPLSRKLPALGEEMGRNRLWLFQVRE